MRAHVRVKRAHWIRALDRLRRVETSATLLVTRALLVVTMFASRNKCFASTNKCLTSSNKKLLVFE